MTRRITMYVTRHPYKSTENDSHNNPKPEYGDPEEVGIYEFDPGNIDDPELQHSDRYTISPKIFGPYEMPFKPLDLVEVDNFKYEIWGEQKDWYNRNAGNKAGSVVTLWKVF